MAIDLLIIILSLALMIWSADRFVEGAASTASRLGIPPLLVGMVVLGFGTSAPEMVVATLSALKGNPALALGNAYGSNIANIALVLGVTALIYPIVSIHSRVVRREIPILLFITALAGFFLYDAEVSRMEAFIMLALFALLMGWSIWQGFTKKTDDFGKEVEQELESHDMTLSKAIFWMLIGVVLLVVSAHFLVSGAVDIAKAFGVSDLLIGLTIVAVGTSLPELAASIVAVKKGESDIALGNILGSNLFNTLAVVGIAGAITPMTVSSDIFYRDIPVMALLTVLLFIFSYGFKGAGSITRLKGGVLLSIFIAYNIYLVVGAIN